MGCGAVRASHKACFCANDPNSVQPCKAGECGDFDFEFAKAFVAEVPALRLIPKLDVPVLVKAMTKREHGHFEVLIQQGQQNDQLFIVLHGEAKVLRSAGSVSTTLATLHPGDYFGEQELLHAQEACATVQATGVTQPALVTFSVTHETLQRLGFHKWLRIPKRRGMVDLRTAHRNYIRQELPGLELGPKKTPLQCEFIATALRCNSNLSTFCSLTSCMIERLTSAASLYKMDAGDVIMRQGDFNVGSFYIVQSGAFEIHGYRYRGCRGIESLQQTPLGDGSVRASAGDSFGETELTYSAPCVATVTAAEASAAWLISHSDFVDALRSPLRAKLDGYVAVLRGVELFNGLRQEELSVLAEVLTEISYDRGEDVITQGDMGCTFFVLADGEAVVLCDGVNVRTLVASREQRTVSSFGDMELVRPQRRIATIRVTSEVATVLALPKASFDLVLEPFEDVLRAIADEGPGRTPKLRSPSKGFHVKRLPDLVAREDLQLRGRLGTGGFGVVDLAVDRLTKQQYALKRIIREKITEPYLQGQILNEKLILSICHSPFVVRLFGTFRDATTLAFLLELAPCGDLMDALYNHELHGNAQSARFFIAGILLAIGHLHDLQIRYRDLKPENVLLDADGWPKLTDFGFAKIASDKSFTCCGTPCYMAPEVWLKIGHCEAVDWWALGVLTYEVMSARTPFENDDGDEAAMRKAIEQGIESTGRWTWPHAFTSDLQGFVAALLKPDASQRLPMQAGGLANLREHPWFSCVDFDWGSYEARTLKAHHACLFDSGGLANLPPSPDNWIITTPPTSTWDVDF